MIEKRVLNFLSTNMEVPCYMEKPPNAPKKYIIVEKTGSSLKNHIYSAMFTINSYAPTMYEAAALNEEAKKVIENISNQDEICKVSLNSDYNFTDTSMKGYRYQAVFDIVHY